MSDRVELGTATLLQGDCVELMAELEPCSVDAVITDPPYMIGAISTGSASAKAGGWADMENSAWWYAEWLKLARRSLKQEGYACVFGNWRSLPTLLYAFAKIKWPVDSLLIWDKEWIGPASPRQLRPTYEVVLFAGMPKAKIDDRSASDVYRCRWMAGNSKTTPHAAEKPVDLMRHLVRLTTNPGQLVLDPFMGSGTTGEAAHLEGRRFIGMERETEYFQGIAVPRVREAQRQGTMLPPEFTEPVERPLYGQAELAAAVADEREQCARTIDAMWNEYKASHPCYRTDYQEGYLDALDAAEQRIRGPNVGIEPPL